MDLRLFDIQHDPSLPPDIWGAVVETFDANWNPSLARSPDGRVVMRLGDAALQDRSSAVETIAHELNHVRGYMKTGEMTSEAAAEAAAQKAKEFLR